VIPIVGMLMDTSVSCTPGESWPYYLANSGCIAGACCLGSTWVYISHISQWVPTFRRGTWLRRTSPDTEVRVRFPVMALPCNPSTFSLRNLPQMKHHLITNLDVDLFPRKSQYPTRGNLLSGRGHPPQHGTLNNPYMFSRTKTHILASSTSRTVHQHG
jgi:hypothetical protein